MKDPIMYVEIEI